MNAIEDGGSSQSRGRHCQMKLALLLVGLVCSAAVFLTLDWFRTTTIQRSAASRLMKPCRVRDPVRHHATQPNCSCTESWGANPYEIFTNSLGFRDEKVREVPLADARPRILMLGDSFTEGKIAWRDSYVGRIAARYPQYDFLNGGVNSYSPSNYLNTARMVLAKGVDIDEVIVFMDLSDVNDEAAYYRDVDASGAVTGPERQRLIMSWHAKWRSNITKHLLLTHRIFEFIERVLVGHGYYHLTWGGFGDTFDAERSAWTYRRVNETDPNPAGYAPLGVEGGIAK